MCIRDSLAAWLEMAVVGNHVNWFVPFNILLNTAVSCSVYLIGRRLSRSKGIGFLCGFMYLMSRMAYYQIGQVLGLMETMALLMAIGILWYLYRYICLLYTSQRPLRPWLSSRAARYTSRVMRLLVPALEPHPLSWWPC